MKKNILLQNPLKIICIVGLILTLAISWGLVFSAVLWGRAGKEDTQSYSFARNLREYDLYNAPKRVLEGENPQQIERFLSRLQRQARSVEEHLSVLKRRRALAEIDRNYISSYAGAAMEAADKFAHSAPLAAVAAEAVLLSGTITGETLALLNNYSGRLSQNRFDMLYLSLNVLAGNLDNPVSAAALPGLPDLYSIGFSVFQEESPGPDEPISRIPLNTQRDLLTNEFLLLINRGDISTASYRINNLLNIPSPEIIRMGADFFYDHQNPLRAAELYLRLSEENDLARAAEALALAGEISGARNIWRALSAINAAENQFTDMHTRMRIFYNLAATSIGKIEEESWLERIFSMPRQGNLDSLGIFSIIRYARLLENEQSISVLNEVNGTPLVDLELLRNRQLNWPHTRAAAEVWVLLGRHSENEMLHEWAAWYFEHQKLHSESERLIKEALRKGMAGSWLDLHRSFALIREGKTSEAEKILETYCRDSNSDWRFFANLGRIQESRRAISSALEYYENASVALNRAMPLHKDRSSAAQLQMRISRCLEALGHSAESLRALEAAYELDSENINIRREYARRRL